MNNGRRVILRVFAFKQRVINGRFAQIALGVAFRHTGVNGFFQRAAGKMHFLPYFQKHHCKPGILAQGHIFTRGKFRIFNNGFQNLPA